MLRTTDVRLHSSIFRAPRPWNFLSSLLEIFFANLAGELNIKIAEQAAIVTGAGSGLARTMTIGLASPGARIMAADGAQRARAEEKKKVARKAAEQKHSPAT